MIEQKNIQEMTRREYCSYVQRQYQNDPQWVRTRLISKWDQENAGKKAAGQPAAKLQQEKGGHLHGQDGRN